MTDQIKELLKYGTAAVEQKRWNVLSPLLKMLGLALFAATATTWVALSKGVVWPAVVAWSFVGLLGATFVGLYIFFATTKPEMLQTEKFLVTKMALERARIGDDKVGLLPVDGKGALEALKPITIKPLGVPAASNHSTDETAQILPAEANQ